LPPKTVLTPAIIGAAYGKTVVATVAKKSCIVALLSL